MTNQNPNLDIFDLLNRISPSNKQNAKNPASAPADVAPERPARELTVSVDLTETATGARFANVVLHLNTRSREGVERSFFLTIHPREISGLIKQLKEIEPEAIAAFEEIEQERNAARDFDGVRRPVMRPGKTARDRESSTRGSAPTNVPTLSQSMKGKRVGGGDGSGKGKGKGGKR